MIEGINALLIPLIGGFIFVMMSKIFRHQIIRHDGQFLFFLSASFGLLFLILSFLGTKTISYYSPGFQNWWASFVPFLYSGTAFGALVIALICIVPFSFMHRKKVIEYLIRTDGSTIENMIYDAMSNALMICITLENDKVYVGFVANPFESTFGKLHSIKLLPSLSGYRDIKKSIIFTNYYEEIIQDVEENPDNYIATKEYISVTIPLSRVVTINYFDPAIYDRFNEQAID